MASLYNLLIEQGATFERNIRFTSVGLPIDLTGWSGRAQARRYYGDPVVLVEFSVITLGDLFLLSLTHAQTNLLPANCRREAIEESFALGMSAALLRSAYVWDFDVTDAVGRVFRKLEGHVLVTPGVTQ